MGETKENEERIYFWDNIKFLLIVLVVVGHAIDLYTKDSLAMKELFLFIYIFHMPLFIFISGYFSKGAISGKKLRVDKVFMYLILYVMLKTCFFIMSKYLFKEEQVTFNLLTESMIPWYLFAMSVWYCGTYFIKKLNHSHVFILSIILSIAIGYNKNIMDFLCLSRIIVFFPFFILGYYLNKENIIKILSNKKLKIVSLSVFVITIIAILKYGDSLYTFRGFFTGRNPYAVLNEPIYGGIYRLLFYGLSTFISLAIMYLVPKKKLFISKLGRRTIQVYFLHDIIISICHHYNIESCIVNSYQGHWVMLYIVCAILLTFIISLKVFEYPFQWLFKLKLKKQLIQ